MKYKYYYNFFFFIFFQNTISQEIYFTSGINYSKFYNKNTSNTTYLLHNSNQLLDFGRFIELGIITSNTEKVFRYSTGLTYNQFNFAYAIDGYSSKYYWQTDYLGIQNSFLFRLYDSNNLNLSNCYADSVKAYLKLGVNAAYLFNGYQDANGIIYKVNTHDDFKRIIFQPTLGLNMTYPISNSCNFYSGYSISIADLGNDFGNTFNIINHSLFIGTNLSF
ncbi:MAG: hypothetical protein RIQ59_1122 [Bacteroidota bacterium]|jgi:hypothetical protein